MRLNAFIAQQTGISRRRADTLVERGFVMVNGQPAAPGHKIQPEDLVSVKSPGLSAELKGNNYQDLVTIALNKPGGFVCSREGQGSKTVYDLLPEHLHHLKLIGRLDKDSSGLILLTNDGQLAQRLTHPRYQKEKVYEVRLDKPLRSDDMQKISKGVLLDDGPSKFKNISNIGAQIYEVALAEGRNRQIRRTFSALGYEVRSLQRLSFAGLNLKDLNLREGSYIKLAPSRISLLA
jgi:23S rRNA pseudouridine2605 synthase